MSAADEKETDPRLIPADPAKAFHIISDMEQGLVDIELASAALRIISISEEADIFDVVGWLAHLIFERRGEVEKLRCEALHLLHGCAYPRKTPDPDDELVAAWDEWRREWLAYKERDDGDDSRLSPLEHAIIDTPAHGLRGIAAKTGHTLWYQLTVNDQENATSGLRARHAKDMDWDIRCLHELALELERLTDVVVHPRWNRP